MRRRGGDLKPRIFSFRVWRLIFQAVTVLVVSPWLPVSLSFQVMDVVALMMPSRKSGATSLSSPNTVKKKQNQKNCRFRSHDLSTKQIGHRHVTEFSTFTKNFSPTHGHAHRTSDSTPANVAQSDMLAVAHPTRRERRNSCFHKNQPKCQQRRREKHKLSLVTVVPVEQAIEFENSYKVMESAAVRKENHRPQLGVREHPHC